ncbi:MAG: alpha/beta fold hydrolase [Anaerolineaceae bacterium]
MPIENNAEILVENGWTFRVQPPDDSVLDAPAMLLMHGWSGDENVMNVFTSRFPTTRWYLAPRAPFPTPDGGFGWFIPTQGQHSTLDDFRPQVEGVLAWLDAWSKGSGVNVSQLDLMGFSQGAAMVLCMALLHPERVHRLAVLSGYLPSGSETVLKDRLLEGKRILIAHGLRDEVISIDRAHDAVDHLRRAGADVEFCTSDIGHKLSAHCMKAVQRLMFNQSAN